MTGVILVTTQKPNRHELPIALVDVDNTICEFAHRLHIELSDRHGDIIPHFNEWNDWNFWKSIILPEQFYSAVRICQEQPNQCKPIRGASELLYRLRRNYYITIASHRVNTPEVNIKLMDWLFYNDMPYHSIYLSYDKTVLFPTASLVIDDSPEVLQKASAYYQDPTKVYGLRQPWNSHMNNNPYITMVDSLLDIIKELDKHG